MENESMMRAQSYAVSMEHILRRIFNCDRGGFGGIVDADFIRKQPLPALYCGLSYLYPNSEPEKKAQIVKFIEDNTFFDEMSVDFLLSFDKNEKTVGNTTLDIGFPNGEEALQNIINYYRRVVE